MSYLRFRNWERYQNADLAKKSGKRGLPWIKLWTHPDEDLNQLCPATRLLFYELLKLAGLSRNVIERDVKRISSLSGLTPQQVAKGVEELLKGAWLRETKTNRMSRETLENTRDKKEIEKEISSKAFVENGKVAEIIDLSLRSVG